MRLRPPLTGLVSALALLLALQPARGAVQGETGTVAAPAVILVACAPGFPGSTEEAQPTMDAFADQVAADAGLAPGQVAAVYDEQEEAGRARLAADGPLLAMVPLPFFARYEGELALTPVRSVEPEAGEDEVWSLVARKGRVAGPADLAGWEITGQPGYAPAFVRGPLLGRWGELPADVRITFTARALSALRRAQRGEDLAVLVDRAQAEALPSLPFGGDLEVVARSRPLPSTLLCRVGDGPEPGIARAVLEALDRMHDSDAGREALAGIRVRRFRPVNERGLADLRAALPGD